MANRTHLILNSIFFVALFGLGLLSFLGYEFVYGQISEDWLETDGRVLSVKVKEIEAGPAPKEFIPEVVYAYKVKETEYFGNRIGWGTLHFINKRIAHEIIDRHGRNMYDRRTNNHLKLKSPSRIA